MKTTIKNTKADSNCRESLVRLWLWMLCMVSEWAADISSWADRLAIGATVRAAEKKALKSNNPDDVEKFMELVHARADMLPEVCSAKQTLAAMLNQVRRRQC